jgi:hypothetical protein
MRPGHTTTQRAIVLLVALSFAASGDAWAKHAIALLGTQGKTTEEVTLGNGLTSTLRAQLARLRTYSLTRGRSLAEIKLVFGCADLEPACMARAGKTLRADLVLWGDLSPRDEGGYRWTVTLLDVAQVKVKRTVAIKLGANTDRTKAIELLIATLFPPNPGTIAITSAAVGAEIFLGGKPVGRVAEGGTTLRGIKPGIYTLDLKLAGHLDWSKTLTVKAGETLEVAISMTAVPAFPPVKKPPPVKKLPLETPPPVPEKSTRTGWRAAFWTSVILTVGAAVGAAVSGASLSAIEAEKNDEIGRLVTDQQVSDAATLTDPSTDVCAYAEGRYSNIVSTCNRGRTRAWVANGLWIGAGVMAIVSGVLLYKAYLAKDKDEAPKNPPREEEKSVTSLKLLPSIAPGNAGLGLSFEF